MLGLPKSTEIYKKLPKTQIYDVLHFSNKEKTLFDENISSLYFVAQISNKSIPSINDGDEIKNILFLQVNLKKETIDIKILEKIYSSISQTLVLVLIYDNKYQLSINYGKIFKSEYINVDTYKLKIDGNDLDTIYKNFVKKIGDIKIEEDRTLSEQIIYDTEKKQALDKIKILQNKLNNEKQFNKKVLINKQINELKTKYVI